MRINIIKKINIISFYFYLFLNVIAILKYFRRKSFYTALFHSIEYTLKVILIQVLYKLLLFKSNYRADRDKTFKNFLF